MKKNNMKRIRRLDSLPSMSHFETSYGARGILLKKDDMQNMVWWYYQPPTDDKTVREYYFVGIFVFLFLILIICVPPAIPMGLFLK